MIFMTNNGKEEICGLKEQLAFRPALPVNPLPYTTGSNIIKTQANTESTTVASLMLKIDGEIVCNYDRGWDVRPTCKAAEVALEILLYEYDGRNEE